MSIRKTKVDKMATIGWVQQCVGIVQNALEIRTFLIGLKYAFVRIPMQYRLCSASADRTEFGTRVLILGHAAHGRDPYSGEKTTSERTRNHHFVVRQ